MKKLLCVILSLALYLTSFSSVAVKAATNEIFQEEAINALSLPKENFNYLEGKPGDTHLVYTYESNGNTYKVVESANDNFTEVDSTIYVEDENGVFVEYATQNLTVNNSIFTLTTNANGEITTETRHFPLEMSDTLNEDAISSVNSNSENYQTLSTCYGYDVGMWEVAGTYEGNNAIVNWTVSAVVAVVAYVATASTTRTLSGAAATAAGTIASKIVDMYIPIVYYEQTLSERRLEDPPAGLGNFPVAIKWYTKFYEDRNHNDYLGAVTEYSYHECYGKDDIF